MPKKTGKIRIIGGKYKRLYLPVLLSPGLRPTLNSVRETLFNWLGQDLTGLTCLDLFAGSGALGFEALSRGAHSVTMIEKEKNSAQQLRENRTALRAHMLNIMAIDAFDYLRTTHDTFDIIFLDPPFDTHREQTIYSIIHTILPALKTSGFISVEHPKKLDMQLLADAAPSLSIHRSSKVGRVYFYLLKN